MPTITKLYSIQEAAEHNTRDDCWVVIDGKVYDVSSYLDEHPGGDDVMLAVTGKDATDEFEDAGHSKTARELLEKFFIGELDTFSSPISESEPQSVLKKQRADILQQLMDVTELYWVVPAAVIGIFVVVGMYLRRK